MEPWVWGVIAGVPIIGLGVAYAAGAFSTNIPALDEKIYQEQIKRTEFTGDDDVGITQGGRRKHKTKKSKSKNRKTRRRR